MYKREDFPFPALGTMLRPAIWATDRVVDPHPGVRPEWQILDEIARRLGVGGAYAQAPLRLLAKLGVRVKPRTLADILIRTSPAGDMFGLRRSGVSFTKLLRDHPHGKVLAPELPVGRFPDVLKGAIERINLRAPQLLAEIDKLADVRHDPRYPLRLHGLRETRSHNSWMHNALRLMPDSRRLTARVNPDDASAAGLSDGEQAVITSASGSITVPVTVTQDMSPGNIALPHGWGHSGGWKRANAAGGANSNVLASSASADIETLAGMSILNGIPVRLERDRTVLLALQPDPAQPQLGKTP
jgi:formate dehydrogenase